MGKEIWLQHIGIGAKDVKKLVDWYCNILGLEKVYEIPATEYRSGMPCVGIGNEDKIVIEFFQNGEFNPLTGKPLTEDEKARIFDEHGEIKEIRRELIDQGVNHIGFRVDDFEKFLKSLEKKGVSFIKSRKTSKGWTMGMLSDPEGNLVEIFWADELLPYEE